MKFRDLFKNKKNTVQRREGQPVNVIYQAAPKRKYTSLNSANMAMTNSVVYRGISVLSDSVASIPMYIYRKNIKGDWEIDTENSLFNLLTRRCNDRQTIYELLENAVIQMILYGNAYIFIKKNSKAEIKELILCSNGSVFYNAVENNYKITDSYNHIDGTFNYKQVIHLKHKSIDSIVGQSTIQYAAQTLGVANAADSEALALLNSGGLQKGVISAESQVVGFGETQDSQLQDIRTNLEEEILSGKDILTIPSGVRWQTMSQTNRDAMTVDIKQYSLSDVARFLGISLSKLYISFGGNYRASADENLSFFTDTLNPLLCKFERAFNTQLIPDSISKKYKIQFDRSTLAYYKDILENYQKAQELGIMTVNDIRKVHNKAMIEDGDKAVISTNLQTVEQPKVVANNLNDNKLND